MTLLSILLVGFLLGMKHATETDHLAAMATLAAGKQTLRQTLWQGVAWGTGHTATLMLFGGIVLLLGKAVPPSLELSLELAVGVMLVALGADVLRCLRKEKIHFHAHSHQAGARHVHAHSHLNEVAVQKRHAQSEHQHPHARWLPWRALLVGMMHGMAGTAALILLSLEAVQNVSTGLVYILCFGVGSIIGMAVLSTVISIPLRLSVGRLTWLHQGVTLVFGGASCLIGLAMVYRIGFVERLLLFNT